MRNYLTFGGVDCRDYGVYISGSGVFDAPARAYDLQSIPGRDGALLGTEMRLENIEVTYPAFVYSNFFQNVRAWRSYLLSCRGYQRLTDTYYPDEYRLGLFVGPLDVGPTKRLDAGSFEMVFNCKPQRYLLSGETPITISSTSSITNPTLFPSKPLITVHGTGSVSFGGVTITVTEEVYSSLGTSIDCDRMDAYCVYNGSTLNLNRYVQLSQNDYPELPAGTSQITVGNGISSVVIVPRWWQL